MRFRATPRAGGHQPVLAGLGPGRFYSRTRNRVDARFGKHIGGAQARCAKTRAQLGDTQGARADLAKEPLFAPLRGDPRIQAMLPLSNDKNGAQPLGTLREYFRM